MKQFTLAQRLRYQFDNLMAQGTIALIGWLFLISLILIVIVSFILALTGNTLPEENGNQNFLETMWLSLMHTIDGGTIAGDSTGNLFYLTMMFIITAGGIFIFSALIGLLTSGIDTKLDELRKGRSSVVEEDHTIILGWSSQIFSIIEELVIANANKKYACIAILADQDKVEMEEAIFDRIPDTKTTRIVCRTGNPIDINHLQIMNPNSSRSIILLSDEAEDPDAYVIKTILALTNNPTRRPEPYHIVAEMRDPQNLEVAKMVASKEAKIIPVREIMSRLAVQTSQQSGLSSVYMELLNYEGSEIYLHHEPQLVGKTMKQSMMAYENSTLMGLKHENGQVNLTVPMDYTITAKDKLIVLAEDDDKIHYSYKTPLPIDESQIVDKTPRPRTAERVLILGWNGQGTSIVNELDYYLAAGSETTVVAEVEGLEEIIAQECPTPKNHSLTIEYGNTSNRRLLDRLNIPSYQHVMTLSYSDTLGVQEADAKSLITLLHLRDIREKAPNHFTIVSEMLDLRNRQLAEVTRADDFIVGDRLVSLMLSQVSETSDLLEVLIDLFSAEGSEIYLRPISDYIKTDVPVNFYTLTEAAARHNEVALGYRLLSEAMVSNKAYGVHVNPSKSQSIRFSEDDKVIVLAVD